MSEIKGLCPNCENSIFCDTWAEWKCVKYETRVYDYADMSECDGFKRRSKIFKPRRCQCEDCLKNELLAMMRADEAAGEK